MQRRLRFFFLFSFFLFSAPLFAFNLSERVIEYHLPNGMTWLLVQRHEAPVFAGYISVKVGGVDEVPGKTGLAHMFEHLMFKGTSKLAENEIWEIFTRNGSADLNASTSKDATEYHAGLPINRLELWMKVFAEMFRAPELRNFYTERSVVLEERRMRVDNDPQGYALETLTNTAFADGPNHYSVIGSADDIAHLTDQDAIRFYAQHYGAKNMTGVLVGDLNIAVTKKLLLKYFTVLPAGEKTTEPMASSQRSDLSVKIKAPAEPRLTLAYHKLGLPNPVQYTFDIAQTLLCDGASSRLYKTLVLEKKIAKRVACGDGFPGQRTPDLLLVVADPVKGVSLKKLQREIEQILQGLVSQPASAEEMMRARQKCKAHFVFNLSSNNAIASQLAGYQTLYGDWHLLASYLDKVNAVTSEDVLQLATQYFQSSNQVVVYRERK